MRSMQAITPPRSKRIVRNPGLSAFARQEKVTIAHAYRVVMGDRKSIRLLAAWQEFKAQRQEAAS